MQARKVEHILCAVRGVPHSRKTVTKAIDLALEHGARLTFAHVTSADFLVSATPVMTSLSTVYKQLRNMSEFAMLVLLDRANRRGVEKVDYLIREGQIINQIYTLVRELSPDILVMGKPAATKAGSPNIKSTELEDFAARLEESEGIRVVLVDIDFEGN